MEATNFFLNVSDKQFFKHPPTSTKTSIWDPIQNRKLIEIMAIFKQDLSLKNAFVVPTKQKPLIIRSF